MKKNLIVLASVAMFMVAGCGDKSSNNVVETSSLGENSVVEDTKKEEHISLEDIACVEIPFGYLNENGYESYFELTLPGKTIMVDATCESGTKKVDVEANIYCDELVEHAAEYEMDYATFMNSEFLGGSVVIIGYEYEDTFEEFVDECFTSYREDEEVIEDAGKKDNHAWNVVHKTYEDGTYSYILLMQFDQNIAFGFMVYGSAGAELIYDVESAKEYLMQAITILD